MSAPRHSGGGSGRRSYGRQKRNYAADESSGDESVGSNQSYRGSSRNSQRGDCLQELRDNFRNSGRVIGTPDVAGSNNNNNNGFTPGRTPRQVSFIDTPGATPHHNPQVATITGGAAPSAAAASSAAGGGDKTKPIFSGLSAATITPMLPNGDVDTKIIRSYGEALKDDGISGVLCNGTTGESMSLSVRERMAITEQWVATGLQVCTHIGCFSLAECCELAAHAQRVGAHGIAVMVPNFFKPQTINEYVDFLAAVSAAAPRIPLLVYHFPVLSGISFKLFDILTACQKRGSVPNLRGAKFTNLDFGDYIACKGLPGITDMFYSQEQNMAAAAFLGATSFVGMQFSVIGPLYKRLAAAGAKGNQAETLTLQKLAVQYINMVGGIVGNTVEKAIAATKFLVSLRLQQDCGEPRAPGCKLTNLEAEKLKDGFEKFVATYSAAVKTLGGGAAAAAPAAKINVRIMEGYRGLLDDRISARISDISKRLRIRDLESYFPHLHNPGWRKPMPDENANAAQYIDHTILKPEATKVEVSKLCDEAKKHNFYAVCVNGSRVKQCVNELKGSSVHVAAVIGFPLGSGTIEAHAEESHELMEQGVDEIDMVMNVGAFKDGDYKYVYEDIKAVVEASAPAIVKVIFESCLLNRDEVIDAAILSVAAGAHFVKTSTGFNKGGATPEAIDAMLAVVGNEAQVKASGGVRDAEAAGAYISAGVMRIGTSSGVAIVSGKKGTGY